ncbi:hypothetical protein Ahy_A07g031704 isoform B [Arachis hypogaea]|uniref:Uncharacterized protein n=1 Tax=Arachis hypogaea TaxID=3818 RepID=A0A445C4Q4_ARAHY|nr:hypothetical protein Ahy_A07g031704 isoform B [Arachis hypogaea]
MDKTYVVENNCVTTVTVPSSSVPSSTVTVPSSTVTVSSATVAVSSATVAISSATMAIASTAVAIVTTTVAIVTTTKNKLHTELRIAFKVARSQSFTLLHPSMAAERGFGDLQPSIWKYEYIQSLISEYKEESHIKKREVLKEEVRMMLYKVENHVHQLELIDILQRLGVAYHFKDEIKSILDNIYNMEIFNTNILYTTALGFRILRQHGYDISADVFDFFLKESNNFKEHQSSIGIEGILSLYEASFYLVEEETILDDAKKYSSKILKEHVKRNNDGSYTSLLINHSLEYPLHWRVPRWEALWFINTYEKSFNLNLTLLQFAKLDFNIVQSIYQEELKDMSRWWKRTNLAEKLSFARDRLVENFFWTVGMNFNPEFGSFRRAVTKVNCLVNTIDDMYEIFGTLEDLELFTKAIERWDISFGMDNLPYHMKMCFLALNNFVNEVAFESLQNNEVYIVPFLRKSWADLCKAYFVEAKWYYSGYIPTFEEYLENGWRSISSHVLFLHAYFTLPNALKKEQLDSLKEYPNMIRLTSLFCRLVNDLGTYKREKETGDAPSSIQCYMKKSGASEAEACEHVRSIMNTLWKNINKEAHHSSLSQDFIDSILGLTRMVLAMYDHGDYHTFQDSEAKSGILSLIIQPIPLTR